MSTQQAPPRHANKLRSRSRAALVALSAVIAVGVGALFIAMLGNNGAHTPSSSIARGQVNYRFVQAAPQCHFRDPATHRLLRIHTKRCDIAQLRAEESGGATP